MTIAILTDGSYDFGPCACCGSMSRTIWGAVHAGSECVAVYYVQWTLKEVVRHGAHFDLIVGSWGEDVNATDHRSVSLAYQLFESGPSFMVIDAATRPVAQSAVAGQLLARTEVIDTPLAQAVFMTVDAILLQDQRLAELTA